MSENVSDIRRHWISPRIPRGATGISIAPIALHNEIATGEEGTMAQYSWDLGINWDSLSDPNSDDVELSYGFVQFSPQNQAGVLSSPLDQTVVQGDTLTVRFFNITGVNIDPPVSPPSLQLSEGTLHTNRVVSSQTLTSPFDSPDSLSLNIGEQTTGGSAVFGDSLPMWQCQSMEVENSGWFNLLFQVKVDTPGSSQKVFIIDPEMVVGAQSGGNVYEKA